MRKLKAMPPKLVSDDGRHIVIRPLAYCKESDIARHAEARAFPIIPCDLCGSQENFEAQAGERNVAYLEKQHSGRVETIFSGLMNVKPSHSWTRRFRLCRTGTTPCRCDSQFDGDLAFDTEDFPDTSVIPLAPRKSS